MIRLTIEGVDPADSLTVEADFKIKDPRTPDYLPELLTMLREGVLAACEQAADQTEEGVA